MTCLGIDPETLRLHYPMPHSVGSGGFLSAVNRSEREGHNLSPSSAEVTIYRLFPIRIDGLQMENFLSASLVTLKGKFVPVHAVKAQRGSRGIILLIINLDGRRW